MPSRRKLLGDLDVARATLTRAVAELQTEGILTVRQRDGVFTTARARLATVAFAQYWEPYNLDPFDLALMSALTRYGPDYGLFVEIHLLGAYERPDEDRLAAFHRAVTARRYAGILSMTSRALSGWRTDLEKLGLPLEFNPVVIDHQSMEELGVGLLCQRGCSRIGFLGHADEPNALGEARFREALDRHGLTFHPEWYVVAPVALPLELMGYRNFLAQWKAWKVKPDAMVSDNDHITQGMLYAVRDLGIAIPGDLQIATHANRGLSQFICSDIVRLEVDVVQAAQLMLERLRDRINGVGGPEPTILRLEWAEDKK